MRRSIRLIALSALFLAVGLFAGAAAAQQKTLKDQLEGLRPAGRAS